MYCVHLFRCLTTKCIDQPRPSYTNTRVCKLFICCLYAKLCSFNVGLSTTIVISCEMTDAKYQASPCNNRCALAVTAGMALSEV